MARWRVLEIEVNRKVCQTDEERENPAGEETGETIPEGCADLTEREWDFPSAGCSEVRRMLLRLLTRED